MGSSQGGRRLLDQAEAAGTERTGTGSPLGLDQVGAGRDQIDGQLFLLIQRQNMGHGDRQHHFGQQGTGATGEVQHLLGAEDAPEGIEGVEIADLHHGRTGLHGGREQLRIDRRDADRQSRSGGSHEGHQLGIAGHIDQIGTACRCRPGDPLHRCGIEVGETGNDLQQTTTGHRVLQSGRQAGKAGHWVQLEDRGVILPSEPSTTERGWGPHQLRLHRQLLRRPELLPKGAGLLLAVSGGQDSMALTRLLRDLQPLHHWRLRLWHGDHGWRAEATAQARELKLWAESEGLELEIAQAPERGLGSEAAARSWRYDRLARSAVLQGCTHVVTGHTASDRTETVLLNLARGCHLRGLASLRPLRPLTLPAPDGAPLLLSRPLLLLSRADTYQLCQERNLPVWLDTTNADPRFSRNRLRAEVLPVLEELHPGASRRISGLAERLAAESEQKEELLDLALEVLGVAEVPRGSAAALQQRRLGALSAAIQRQLLQRWLETQRGRGLESAPLEQLIRRLAAGQGSGRMDLAAGWQLRWDGATLLLHSPEAPHG